jgi:G:T-mismatch repair DNA endonuclease (very short patch repair protein)/DNA-directed RNA polymerase subunit RPC12/RpoP
MSDIFICKHCGKKIGIKQFARHLWKIHNQKYEDYVKEHLNEFSSWGWKLCSECGAVCRSTSTRCGTCYTKTHDIKENQYIQCHYCGAPVHSKVISIHLKTYHCVGFLDYVKNHLADFEKMGWCRCVICSNVCRSRSKKHNNPTCSPGCLQKARTMWVGKNAPRFGAILSNETKQKISISNTGKEGLKGDLNPACRKEVREKISKTRIKLGLSKGKNNPMFGKTHTPESIKKIFSHRPMNKLERLVADQLDKSKIKYKFQYFINDGSLCKSYDFKINGKPLILEVDGDFWHGNPSKLNHYEKVNEVKQNDRLKEEMASKRNIKVVRLWESDIKKDHSIVMRTLSPYIY